MRRVLLVFVIIFSFIGPALADWEEAAVNENDVRYFVNTDSVRGSTTITYKVMYGTSTEVLTFQSKAGKNGVTTVRMFENGEWTEWVERGPNTIPHAIHEFAWRHRPKR